MFEELDNNTLFWLEHVFRGKNALPRLEIQLLDPYWTLEGQKLPLRVKIENMEESWHLSSMELGFKEQVKGFEWKVVELLESSSMIVTTEYQGVFKGSFTFSGFLVPLKENIVVVARFSNGVVISSVLLKTSLFHLGTIPMVFILDGVLIQAIIVVFRREERIFQQVKQENEGKKRMLERTSFLVLHYGIGGIIILSYLACLTWLPWFTFEEPSWVAWTVLEFLDVFVHRDLFVYLLLVLFLGSTISWLFQHDWIASVLMFIPPMILMMLSVAGVIPEEFPMTFTLPLSMILALGMAILSILERMTMSARWSAIFKRITRS